jgi:aryl-phospho-beta-D-glucosidase BglC (GH1 family)
MRKALSIYRLGFLLLMLIISFLFFRFSKTLQALFLAIALMKLLLRLTIICFFCVNSNCLFAQGDTAFYAIKLCGPEFGEKKMPGVYGVDFIYPNKTELLYFKSKGFRLMDLPFKWERVQPKLGGDLDSVEMGRINQFLSLCDSLGLKAKLSMQNFGRYLLNGTEFMIGSPELPVAYFEDVWKKLAASWNGKQSLIGFQIMNEPHDMLAMPWVSIAQKAIDAIRVVNSSQTIFVCGDSYAATIDWKPNNPNIHELVDISDNLVYEAHCYFDKDLSGQYLNSSGSIANAYEHNSYGSKTGVQAVKPFIKWLKKYKKKGFIGEYGVPDDDPRWLTVLDKFLGYISDSGVNGAYWAAGPWWGEYRLSVEPRNGEDRPQMKILERYLYVVK